LLNFFYNIAVLFILLAILIVSITFERRRSNKLRRVAAIDKGKLCELLQEYTNLYQAQMDIMMILDNMNIRSGDLETYNENLQICKPPSVFEDSFSNSHIYVEPMI